MQSRSDLRALRAARGLSLPGLAARSGVSKGYLSQLERGQYSRPAVQVALRIADALGVPLDVAFPHAIPARHEPPAELALLAREVGLSADEVAMLAALHYRGRRPRTRADWWFVWQAVARSCLPARDEGALR